MDIREPSTSESRNGLFQPSLRDEQCRPVFVLVSHLVINFDHEVLSLFSLMWMLALPFRLTLGFMTLYIDP